MRRLLAIVLSGLVLIGAAAPVATADTLPVQFSGVITDLSGTSGPWTIAYAGSAGTGQVVTDAAGAFSIDLTADAFYALTIADVWSGGVSVGVDPVDAGVIVLPGRVDSTVVRVEDTNGVGVAGEPVDVTQSGSVSLSPALGLFNYFSPVVHVVTGADGNVVVPGLFDQAGLSVWAQTNHKSTLRNRVGTAGGTVLTVVPPEPVLVNVSGSVAGATPWVQLIPVSGCVLWCSVDTVTPDGSGAFSLSGEKGSTFELAIRDTFGGTWRVPLGAVDGDLVVDPLTLPVARVQTRVRVVDSSGQGVGGVSLLDVRAEGGSVPLSASLAGSYQWYLASTDPDSPFPLTGADGYYVLPGGLPDDPSITVSVMASINGTMSTVTGAPGQTLTFGNPPTDTDGIDSVVEGGAPNNGDGNGDGLPDAYQANVTSLPALGSPGGAGADYVTVASSPQTTLSSVAVIDPSDREQVPVEPPAGVTLPGGLVNLVLSGDGVGVGSDQTITIYVTSTEGVVGYAKYNTETQEWSLLPSDRVAIFPNRVEIRLTDGGIGDDDGVANGTISDPGGIFTDTAAPVVGLNGVVEGRKYVLGAAPTITCTATDAASGLAGPCTVTVSGGNANGVGAFAATASATDTAGNTATTVTHYKVVYRWKGFQQPIDDPASAPGGTMSVFKSGSTVPAKFSLTNAAGAEVSPLSTPTWTAPTNEGPTSLPVDEAAYALTADSGDVYKATGRAWQYNWKTSKAMGGSIWRVGVRLDDGEVHFVKIALR
ncbi:MAG: PxKF domain-containing protein [Actinobacteria bacterium]|nr:PxKF domain-containing protein [Actinomycetota bacterium]